MISNVLSEAVKAIDRYLADPAFPFPADAALADPSFPRDLVRMEIQAVRDQVDELSGDIGVLAGSAGYTVALVRQAARFAELGLEECDDTLSQLKRGESLSLGNLMSAAGYFGICVEAIEMAIKVVNESGFTEAFRE